MASARGGAPLDAAQIKVRANSRRDRVRSSASTVRGVYLRRLSAELSSKELIDGKECSLEHSESSSATLPELQYPAQCFFMYCIVLSWVQ